MQSEKMIAEVLNSLIALWRQHRHEKPVAGESPVGGIEMWGVDCLTRQIQADAWRTSPSSKPHQYILSEDGPDVILEVTIDHYDGEPSIYMRLAGYGASHYPEFTRCAHEMLGQRGFQKRLAHNLDI